MKSRWNSVLLSLILVGIGFIGLGAASHGTAPDPSSAGPPGDFTVLAGDCQLRWSIIGDQPGRQLGGIVLALPEMESGTSPSLPATATSSNGMKPSCNCTRAATGRCCEA